MISKKDAEFMIRCFRNIERELEKIKGIDFGIESYGFNGERGIFVLHWREKK
jgi:hypothetical protein